MAIEQAVNTVPLVGAGGATINFTNHAFRPNALLLWSLDQSDTERSDSSNTHPARIGFADFATSTTRREAWRWKSGYGYGHQGTPAEMAVSHDTAYLGPPDIPLNSSSTLQQLNNGFSAFIAQNGGGAKFVSLAFAAEAAYAGTFTVGSSPQTITAPGFQPDIVFFVMGNGGSARTTMSYGVAVRNVSNAIEQAAIGVRVASQILEFEETSSMYTGYSGLGEVVSFSVTSFNSNGFTLSTSGTTGWTVSYLALSCPTGKFDITTFDQGATTIPVNLDGEAAEAVLFLSNGGTTVGASRSCAYFMQGWAASNPNILQDRGESVLVDNFNRADEEPISGWTAISGHEAGQIIGNTFRRGSSGGGTLGDPPTLAYHTATGTIGPYVDVYATLSALPGNGASLYFFINDDGSTRYGFYIYGQPGGPSFEWLWSKNGTSQSANTMITSLNGIVSTGDTIGLSSRPNATNPSTHIDITVWQFRPGYGLWYNRGTRTFYNGTALTAGTAGLGSYYNTTHSWDNFYAAGATPADINQRCWQYTDDPGSNHQGTTTFHYGHSAIIGSVDAGGLAYRANADLTTPDQIGLTWTLDNDAVARKYIAIAMRTQPSIAPLKLLPMLGVGT